MLRAFLAALAIVTASSSMADDGLVSVKKPIPKPIGTWTRLVEDGSGWQIVIKDKSLAFKSVKSAEMSATAENYTISDEGILYGYVRELTWTVGENKGQMQVVHPFAFRLKIVGDTMTVSDLQLRSADAKAHAAMTGEFKKETSESAVKPDKSKEVK